MINIESEYDEARGVVIVGKPEEIQLDKRDYNVFQEFSGNQFGNFYKEKRIGIGNNRITSLNLNISANSLLTGETSLRPRTVPSDYNSALKILGGLESLEVLYFPCSQSICLPDSISRLKNLKILELHYGRLTALPESLEELVKLEHIGASHNDIRTLPKCLTRMPSLKYFAIHMNPLDDNAIGIVKELKQKGVKGL